MPTTATENLQSNSDLPKFHAPDAKVVFQSSDGIVFRIHEMNLAACTEGFSPPENSTYDEIVPLPESSYTLELLFQFIYPQPQPELGAIDFETLSLLAEAAEKYRVFPAMNLCTIHMMAHLEDHAEEILLHALKHGIHKLVARAAPLLLDRPLEKFLPTLPDRFVLPWVRYHTQWTNVWKFVISNAPASNSMSQSSCSVCNKIIHDYVLDIIAKLSTDLNSLQDLSTTFEIPTCCSQATRESLKSWRNTLRAEIFLIPTFADIVFPGDTTPSTQETPQTSEVNTNSGVTSVSREFPEFLSKPASDESTYITFLSSDGISFHLREEAIRAWTKSLLPSQDEQQVSLPESSTTLELLFRFLNNSPHPDLEAIDFRVLGPLSLAVDLYGVYPAIQVCNIRRGQALPYDLINRTRYVMNYALKSQNDDLINKSAPLLIGKSSVRMVELFETPSMITSWFEYLEKWEEIVRTALSFSDSRKVSQYGLKGKSSRGCNGCRSSAGDALTISILRKLGKGVKSLRNLDDTFGISRPFCCVVEREDIQAWKAEVANDIERIPSFTSILYALDDSDIGASNEDT